MFMHIEDQDCESVKGSGIQQNTVSNLGLEPVLRYHFIKPPQEMPIISS